MFEVTYDGKMTIREGKINLGSEKLITPYAVNGPCFVLRPNATSVVNRVKPNVTARIK